MITNNVTRFLDAQKVEYQIFELPVEKLGAKEAASKLNISESEIFKTIVTRKEAVNKYVLAVVPGDSEVDLKLLAKAAGEKKMHVVTQVDAEKATHLQVGGISPLALINKGFQVLIDSTANDLEYVYISGGQRGLDIHLRSQDLIRLTHAKVASICFREA
jgi:Cys-tRNA(Pro)/Cys-tRNA(Cys) deacylase